MLIKFMSILIVNNPFKGAILVIHSVTQFVSFRTARSPFDLNITV